VWAFEWVALFVAVVVAAAAAAVVVAAVAVAVVVVVDVVVAVVVGVVVVVGYETAWRIPAVFGLDVAVADWGVVDGVGIVVDRLGVIVAVESGGGTAAFAFDVAFESVVIGTADETGVADEVASFVVAAMGEYDVHIVVVGFVA